MWRFILFIIFVTILYYVLQFLTKNVPSLRKKTNRDNEPEELIQDPYCQTYVPKGSAVRNELPGRTVTSAIRNV